VRCYDTALTIDPAFIDAYYDRGCALWLLKRWHEAQISFEQTLAIQSNHVGSLNNRGLIFMEQGRFDEALADFVNISIIEPKLTAARHNILFCLNYHPDKSAAEVFAAYREFNQNFCAPQQVHWQTFTNVPDPKRRLRIGYVSPDFRSHSTRYFLEPVLTAHNKEVVEVTAYSELQKEDEVTARYRQAVTHWVTTAGMTDDAFTAQIRADKIDILIDLAGHSVKNRLGVFARKPAPISISWLGYAYTTGLTAIDYFLTDEVMVPCGSEHLFSEQLWRLATPAMVYRPDSDIGAVNALPALARGFITFGTLTRGIRINHRVVRVWAVLLQRLPNARLVINSDAFNSIIEQEALAKRFAVQGIDPSRLDIGFNSPPWDVLRSVDITLDCFPHNSGTTLIESLYCGIPVITLADRPSVGRVGSTVVQGAGHPEWIAHSEEEYIEKAIALASDLPRLTAIRASLRDELEASPWRDEIGFTQRLEQTYRDMWQKWCATQPQF
jgi:protein O-GlcNAc transferase